MNQNTSAAVMQQRAPRHVEGDDDLRKRWRDLDFFPTPPWAARACVELILTLDPDAQSLIDPCCGQGHFIEPAREYLPEIGASDIHDYGKGYRVDDFLGADPPRADWIATNPPFGKAAEFIARGLEFARHGVLMLCRIALLEGAGRFELMYGGANPLTVCAPFVERVPMQLGSWDPELHSATCYAAFVFLKGAAPRPIMPIPPGTRDRLWKPTDVARFAVPAPMPLFQGENHV